MFPRSHSHARSHSFLGVLSPLYTPEIQKGIGQLCFAACLFLLEAQRGKAPTWVEQYLTSNLSSHGISSCMLKLFATKSICLFSPGEKASELLRILQVNAIPSPGRENYRWAEEPEHPQGPKARQCSLIALYSHAGGVRERTGNMAQSTWSGSVFKEYIPSQEYVTMHTILWQP